MTCYYHAARKKWVAQVAGFPVAPKKRTRFVATQHDAQIAEHEMRQERDQLKAAASRAVHELQVDSFYTDDEQCHLAYWVQHTCRTKWRNGEGTMSKNAMLICKRVGPTIDVRKINLVWLDEVVEMLRQDYKLSDPRIQALLASLRVVLQQACRRGVIDRMPLFPEGLQSSKESEFLPKPEWVEALIVELGRQFYNRKNNRRTMQLLVQFLRLTGCRVGEALNLLWSDISLADGVIHLKHEPEKGRRIKNKKSHKLPIWSETEAILLELKQLNPAKPFPFAYNTWWQHFAAAREAVVCNLRLPESVLKEWKGHRFRAMSCSEKANMGWSAFDLKEFHNHSAVQMTERYVTSSSASLERIRNLMESQSQQH